MNEIINSLLSFGGSFLVITFVVFAFFINSRLFNRIAQGKQKGTLTYQLISVLIFLVGALIFTISLPIEQSLKEQIISLIGILLSAALAFSSPTLIGNALAGLMNSSIKNFKLGDFIKIETNFGRVTKKGLFRTEIQTEDRNLTSLPNLYIASHPLKIVRDSGTIISTTVSLGYDINHSLIERLLITAAEESGLTEPFVYINNLGDFSVTYKIHGLLTDVNKYFTTHSLLNASIMDNLHKEGIEIVSPGFMNQRQVNEAKFIPEIGRTETETNNDKLPENVVFDKAIEADKIEEKTEALEKIDSQINELKSSKKDGEDKEKINSRIEKLEEQKVLLKKKIEDQKNKLEQHK